MTATVKLNVGGTKYEVSRSVLNMYPDSMLARCISPEWQQEKDGYDLEEEIFLDRNGHRFQFVLDYLRDKSVQLPYNVAKEALLKDMEYFGIDCSDIECIKYSQARGLQISDAFEQRARTMDEMEKLRESINFAIFLMEHSASFRFSDKMPTYQFNWHDGTFGDPYGSVTQVNQYLLKIGLELTAEPAPYKNAFGEPRHRAFLKQRCPD